MRIFITVLKRALSSFGQDKCTSFAAASAYYALFSLFPLIVFILWLLGLFIHDPQHRELVVDAIFKLLGQNVDKNTLYSQVNAFAQGHGGLGVIGLLVSMWSASGIFGAIRTGLNVVWKATKSRPLVQTILLDLGMVLAVGSLVLLSIAATAVLTAIQGFSQTLLGNQLGIVSHITFAALYFVVPPAISFVAFALVYYLVPHAEIRLSHVWPGALLAALAFEVVQFGFAIYVANFAHYDKVYGSLGAVIAFLFFMYISANIVLFGGEVTKQYIDVVSGVAPVEEPAKPPPKRSLQEQAIQAVKGLVVDETPHHDTSFSYEPGRDWPADPSASLSKDEDAGPAGSTRGRGNRAAGNKGRH